MKPDVLPFGDELVRLRLLRESDLTLTLSWRNRDEIRPWFKTSHALTLEQHRNWFRRYSKDSRDYLFVIEAQSGPVGQAAVYDIDAAKKTAEVGRFLIAPEAQGKGYFSAANRALLGFCFGVLNLQSVFLEVKPANSRAISIYKKLGYVADFAAPDPASDAMLRMTFVRASSVARAF